jgi:hypothetical protein
MIHKKIELREERDFGQKFNAVFTFVQSNFKSFFKVIGLTVGPLALIGGFFFGLFFSNMSGMISSATEGTLPTWGLEIFVSYLLLGLASLWMMIAVYAFMAEYDGGNENITVEAVWKRGKSVIMPAIAFAFLTLLAIGFFAAIIFVLPVSNTVGIVFKALLAYGAILYVVIALSLVIPDMVIEQNGLFDSIARSFRLIS